MMRGQAFIISLLKGQTPALFLQLFHVEQAGPDREGAIWQ